MGDQFTESDLQRVKDLGHHTSKDESEDCSESSDASEVKTDDSNRGESKEETSESVAQVSGSASGSEDHSTSTGDSSSAEASDSKSPLVKWQTPEKTDKLEWSDGRESEQEISPSHQVMRPATASSRSMGNVLKEIGKKIIHETPKKIKNLLSPKPKRSGDLLATSGTDESACGEASSSKEAEFTEIPTEPKEPLHSQVTGQQGGFLPPRVRMTQDSANESTTELTSLSSISFADEAFQSEGHALVEAKLSKGSIQDAASLEVDFEEIPSPSKRAKLQMGTKESDSCEEGMVTSDCNNPNDLEEQTENMSDDSEE